MGVSPIDETNENTTNNDINEGRTNDQMTRSNSLPYCPQFHPRTNVETLDDDSPILPVVDDDKDEEGDLATVLPFRTFREWDDDDGDRAA